MARRSVYRRDAEGAEDTKGKVNCGRPASRDGRYKCTTGDRVCGNFDALASWGAASGAPTVATGGNVAGARHAVSLRRRTVTNRASYALEFHREVDYGSYGYASGAFGQPRFAFIYPACRGDVQVDPRGVFCEFFYEPGAGDGAAAFA